MLLVHWLACTSNDTTGGTSSHSGSSETGTTPVTGSETGTTPPPTGVPHLVVENGFGSGYFDPKTALHVWADLDPQREILTGWTGDSDVLDAPAEWNAGLVMPDHDVTVTAVIEAADWTPDIRTYTLEGRMRDAWVITAAKPRGVVLFFHGAGYAIDEVRDNAGSTLVMQLVRANWTVVAMESEAEVLAGIGGWNSTLSLATNTDLRNVQAMIGQLEADGTLDEAAPRIAMGMSSGGLFAHAVGAMGLTDAVVAFCASGAADAIAMTAAPTAWFLAVNDQTFPNAVHEAPGYQTILDGRGLATLLYVHPLTPLYDHRFERVAGITADLSKKIADALRDDGAVDGDDLWTQPGSTAAAALDYPPAVTAEQQVAVGAEIEIMAGDHELYDDTAAQAVAFLDAL